MSLALGVVFGRRCELPHFDGVGVVGPHRGHVFPAEVHGDLLPSEIPIHISEVVLDELFFEVQVVMLGVRPENALVPHSDD